MEPKHDQALLKILKEERNITNFLDTFFGFMYRCTDFYIDSTPEQKLGFPPGVAENLVLTVLHKWKIKFDSGQRSEPQLRVEGVEVPEVVQEVEVETDRTLESEEDCLVEGCVTPSQPSDSYNGAIREDYTWSQTINDLDVLVKIPSYVRKAKDLRVDVTANGIRIAVQTKTLSENNELEKYCEDDSDESEWTLIFDGELSFKTQREESIWCIVPGKYVNIHGNNRMARRVSLRDMVKRWRCFNILFPQIHLEKCVERWWEALIKGEPNIELSKIDCSRPIDDLGLNEQMKVQELMWNQQQKLMGKPTSDQINLEKVLKKAWDVEGSPFKGTEYDPSVVNFN